MEILEFLEEYKGKLSAIAAIVGILGASSWIFPRLRRFIRLIWPTRVDMAKVHFNNYETNLAQEKWEEALAELRMAVDRDPKGCAPFPFENYKPEKILGAGGFGVVFRCKESVLGTSVVIKAYRTSELDRDITTVFEEAKALDSLDDACIIHLKGVNFADSAKTRPYLVMDYFDGMSLEKHVETQGVLTPKDWLQMAIPVARALKAAHASKILHRDVKPDNILVKKLDDGAWRVKLIDFGLAIRPELLKAAASTERLQSMTTLTDKSLAGTMDYSAPEQIGKSKEPVDYYSDVYGFGKTCCYALLGDPNPDFQDKDRLSKKWQKFLDECTARKVENRLKDFSAVLARLEDLARAHDEAPVFGSAVVAEPTKQMPADAPPKARLFFLAGKGIKATGYQSDAGFVVLANSKAVAEAVPSFPDTYAKLRDFLRQLQTMVADKDCLVLKESYAFRTSSAAASVMLARSANGRIEWKDKDGKTLKEAEEEELTGEPDDAETGSAERWRLRKRFWEALLSRPAINSRHASITPQKFGWIGAGSGVRGLPFNYAVTQNETKVELYIDRGKGQKEVNKVVFDQLFKQKDEIEARFGAKLSWQRLDEKQACRIAYEMAIGGYKSDESKWPKIHDAMIDAMVRLENAFAPCLAKLELEMTG